MAIATITCTQCGHPLAEYNDAQVPEMLRTLVGKYITRAAVQHPTGNPGCTAAQQFNARKVGK